MPLRIRRAIKARRDQNELWLYIAANNVKAADEQINRLHDAFYMLASYPDAGRLREEFGSNLRTFPVDHYLIFYRATPSVLEIVRIFHTGRQITPDMLED